jgi:hypothetical protein
MRLSCQLQNTSAQQTHTFLGTNSTETFPKTNDKVTLCSPSGVTFDFLICQTSDAIPLLHISYLSETKI